MAGFYTGHSSSESKAASLLDFDFFIRRLAQILVFLASSCRIIDHNASFSRAEISTQLTRFSEQFALYFDEKVSGFLIKDGQMQLLVSFGFCKRMICLLFATESESYEKR